jgi:tetratricopeptide (TPR) repeat protein
MALPENAVSLLATLADLGVAPDLIEAAQELLQAHAAELGAWVEVAVWLRQQEQFQAALITYDAALRQFPNSHVLYSNRGYVLLTMELYEQALRDFARALEIQPDYARALSFSGAAYERMQQFDRAAECYRKALALTPQDAKSWNSLGVCLLALGNEPEALAAYQQSIASDPVFTDPLFNLAGFYQSRQEYDQALTCVDRLLEIDPDDTRAQALRQSILSRPAQPPGILARDPYEKRVDATRLPPPFTSWQYVYVKPDGARRTDAEVIGEYGKIGLRLAQYEQALQRRETAGENLLNYPLRLFLSYKWGSEAENAWVSRLAAALAGRGWDVVFDRYRDESVDRSVEEFVARIGGCSVFLAVATPAYVAHAINTQDPSWVFDEYQVAMGAEHAMYRIALAPEGQLLIPEAPEQVLRRSKTSHEIAPGFAIPAVIMQKNPTPNFDLILPLPGEAEIETFAARYFADPGPGLSAAQRKAALQALAEVEAAAPAQGIERLRRLLAEHPFIFDAWVRLVLSLTDAGQPEAALQALESAIQNVHPWDRRLVLERERADRLNQLGKPVEAMRAALKILENRSRDWAAHFYVGNRLDDLGELWGARNHLLLASQQEHAVADVFNTLGMVYLGLGFILRARQCFETALQKDANHAHAKTNLATTFEAAPPHAYAEALKIQGPGLGCSVCPAIYPLDDDLPVLCGDCGSRRSIQGSCPCCGGDGFSPWSEELAAIASIACPTCRRGELKVKEEFDL